MHGGFSVYTLHCFIYTLIWLTSASITGQSEEEDYLTYITHRLIICPVSSGAENAAAELHKKKLRASGMCVYVFMYACVFLCSVCVCEYVYTFQICFLLKCFLGIAQGAPYACVCVCTHAYTYVSVCVYGGACACSEHGEHVVV